MKMFQSKSVPNVLHISRAGISIFSPDGGQVTTFSFPEDLFPDLEVTSGEEDFRQRFSTWLHQNMIEIKTCVVLLGSDVYFYQDSTTSEPSQDPEIQSFLAAIPYEDVKVHTAGISTGFRILALNNEWLELITTAIEKLHWQIQMVVPDFVIADVIKPEGLDHQAIADLLSRQSSLFPYNLYSPPDPSESEQPLHLSKSTKITSTTIGLIVFFVLLLVVLAIVIYFSLIKVEPVSKINQPETTAESIFLEPALTAAPIFTVAPDASESASSVSQSEVSIQILNGSGVANQATTLRNELIKQGYSLVTIGNSSSNSISKSIVVFNDKIPVGIQNRLVEVLETMGFSPSIKVSTEVLDADVLITTGREQQLP